MKIAVASDEADRVAAHTGRCQGFTVFEIAGREASRVAFRRNSETAHARNACSGAGDQESRAARARHGGLLKALADCEVVVARGMGPRLIADLQAVGIDGYVCDVEAVDVAAVQYAEGRLARVDGSGCGCGRK